MVPRPASVRIDSEYSFGWKIHVPPDDRINLNAIVLVKKGPAARTNVKIRIRNRLLTLAKSKIVQILRKISRFKG